MPTTDPTAFVLRHGQVHEATQDTYACPAWVSADWSAPVISPDTRSVLPAIAALLHRTVPRAEAHVVPRIPDAEARPGPEFARGLGGYACLDEGHVVLSYEAGAWTLLGTALHEAWHLAEDRLSPADHRLVRGSVARGIALPAGYYDSPMERAARAFESYGLYHLSRSPDPPPVPVGPRTAEQIYAEVLAGRYRPWHGIRTVVHAAPPGLLATLYGALEEEVVAGSRWLARAVRKLLGDASTSTKRRTA